MVKYKQCYVLKCPLNLIVADAQDIVDTVTLQPVLPASGLSACPGQDVTINCTVVRMTTVLGAEQPTMLWVYKLLGLDT